MCGKYLLNTGDLYKRYSINTSLKDTPKLEPNYLCLPGSMHPVVINNDGKEIHLMKWGLIPSWAVDPKTGFKNINARSESINIKPSFRRSFMKKRCLVPASGFYEWKKEKGKKSTPYFIRLKTQETFSFAGLYESWINNEGNTILSYTIITTKPNRMIEQIHERMPVIISLNQEDKWLDINTKENELIASLSSYANDEMRIEKL